MSPDEQNSQMYNKNTKSDQAVILQLQPKNLNSSQKRMKNAKHKNAISPPRFPKGVNIQDVNKYQHKINYDLGRQPDIYQSSAKDKTAEQQKYSDIDDINYNIDSVFQKRPQSSMLSNREQEQEKLAKNLKSKKGGAKNRNRA